MAQVRRTWTSGTSETCRVRRQRAIFGEKMCAARGYRVRAARDLPGELRLQTVSLGVEWRMRCETQVGAAVPSGTAAPRGRVSPRRSRGSAHGKAIWLSLRGKGQRGRSPSERAFRRRGLSLDERALASRRFSSGEWSAQPKRRDGKTTEHTELTETQAVGPSGGTK